MKKLLAVAVLVVVANMAQAQLVARMEVKEDIPGICDKNEVYALFPGFGGQVEAVCPVSNNELLNQLNALPYLKENPKCKGEGMVGIIINCSGKVVKCDIDNKTGIDELDKQILDVFNNIDKQWTSGTLNGKKVDSSQLFSYKIKKGQFVELN